MLLPYLNKELIEAGCDEAGPLLLSYQKILKMSC